MSVCFVVGSEEELSSGGAWCDSLAAVKHLPIHVLVLGEDRKTLAEFARRKMPELVSVPSDQLRVELIGKETKAVLASAESLGCKSMLIVYRSDDVDFQKEVFRHSMVSTLWVRVQGPPPSSSDDLLAMFRRPTLVTTLACEQLFGFSPKSTLCDSVNFEADDLTAEATKAIKSSDDQLQQKLILFGIEDVDPADRVLKAGVASLGQSDGCSAALVHTGHTWAESIAAKIRNWASSIAPPMQREQRLELARDLQTGSEANLEFLGLMSAASMLSAFGLLQDSAAVIIGAMLIAPLMTPILGAGLALTQGNRPLFRSAFLTILLGFVGALVASIIFGRLFALFQEPSTTSEMLARCRPSPLDFCVGLVGGIAASYARTRSHLSSALAGAAIAAALVPPIATAGLQIAFGDWNESMDGVPILGPLLLVGVNVLTIMIGSSFVLWTRGMRSDRNLPTKDRWVVRMFALLSVLVLLVMISILHWTVGR